METLLATLKKWRELVILILFFGAFFVVPARIFAEDFIKKSVGDELAALELQITELQEQLEDAPTGEQLDDLTALIKQQMALIQFLVSSERGAVP